MIRGFKRIALLAAAALGLLTGCVAYEPALSHEVVVEHYPPPPPPVVVDVVPAPPPPPPPTYVSVWVGPAYPYYYHGWGRPHGYWR